MMQELKEISIHEDSPTHSENESHETTSEKNLQSSPKKLWDKLLFFLFVYVYKPLKTYFSKWRGKKEQAPPMLSFEKGLLAFTGSCLSLGIIAVLHYKFLEPIDFPLMQGSFGAASVLLYAAPDSPLSQPKNVIGGQLISSLVGVICHLALKDRFYISAWISVSAAIAAMAITKTIHPPGGATALIAVVGSKKLRDLGFFFILMPTLSGTLIMLLVAIVINNISRETVYPRTWW